ncbi:MAG: mechanosensitive ion channel family protein [Candidatus Thermoplasmatota archaeon]|nr:mechanosensitive ion channel family protein [Candidatus Thermoplasmatota archaeon]
MRRKGNLAVWMVIVCSLAFVISSSATRGVAEASPTAVNILEIDDYSKIVSSNQTATYNWTLQNLYSSVDLTVIVDAEITGTGWTFNTTSDVIALAPEGLGSVAVAVKAPQTTKPSSSNLTVHLKVYDRGYLIQITTVYAVTTVDEGSRADHKVLGFFRNPLPAPLNNEWGVFLLDVAVWTGIAFLALVGLIPLMKRLGSKTKIRVADIVIRIIRTPLLVLIILYGTLQSMNVLEEFLPSGLADMLLKVYKVGLAIVLLYVAYKLFKEVVMHLAKEVAKRTQSHLDDMLMPVIEKLGLVVIGLVGLGVLLGYLQVDLTLFVAGGVVTSMVIAFAAQDTLSNFFSGMFILTDQPFKEGDIVILGDGDWAQVRRIGMRTTRLFRFIDASIITVPNNKLVNEKIANFSNPLDQGRLMKTFNVAYGSDITKVRKIISEAIDASPHILKDEPLKPIIRFDAMSESSLDFFVLVWLDSRDNRFAVTDYLNTEIYTRFNEAGIEIPFPQRTVHVRLENEALSESKTVPLDIERFDNDEKGKQGGRRGKGSS